MIDNRTNDKPKTKKLIVSTTNSDKVTKELLRALFFAAGKTGGAFKISADEAARYEAGKGDVTLHLTESSVDNGDVFVTVVRDRE